MAPRTREQQDIYNAWRREEAAIKRNKAKAAKEAPTISARKTHEPKTMIVKAMKKAHEKEAFLPPKPKPKPGKPKPKVEAIPARKAKAKPKPKPTTTPTKPKLFAEPAQTQFEEQVAAQSKPVHTMARSYVRNGVAGSGMMRGKNIQTTVTFSPEQFAELKDKANFNNRSTAEQIRWSVLRTLKAT